MEIWGKLAYCGIDAEGNLYFSISKKAYTYSFDVMQKLLENLKRLEGIEVKVTITSFSMDFKSLRVKTDLAEEKQ